MVCWHEPADPLAVMDLMVPYAHRAHVCVVPGSQPRISIDW